MRKVKKKNLLKNKILYKNYLFLAILLLFFLTEAWSTIQAGIWDVKSYLPIAVKLGVLVFICAYLLLYQQKYFWLIAALTVSFGIGQLFLNHPFEVAAIGSFAKYLFFLLILVFFVKDNKQEDLQLGFLIFEYIAAANSILIILSYLFEWSIFSSYNTRFGYLGLFMASATGTYFYCMALAYFFSRYKVKAFKKPIFYLVVVGILLLGTKTALLYLIFAFAILIITEIKSFKIKLFIGLSFLVVGCMALYFFLQSGIFKKITENEGWLTSILSRRNQQLIDESLPYVDENWTLINYFFGGLSEVSSRPQMEYFDLLLFFGIIGSSFYLYLIYKFGNFRYIKSNSLSFYLLLLIFVASFISGNFFYNGSTSIYFVVLILVSLENSRKSEKNQGAIKIN